MKPKRSNLRQSELVNDFEKSVFKIEPEIERVKNKLSKFEAEHALLSGSGASVFAVFDSKEQLQNAFETFKMEKDWQCFPLKLFRAQEYRELIKSR